MFTLAHLSDPHLGPLPPVLLRELLNKRMTGYANWHRKRKFIHDPAVLRQIVTDLKAAKPDHIAAVGDFANIGLPAEFERAAEFLGSLGAPTDVTAVPGNHDAYVQGSLPAMIETCGAFMRSDDGHDWFPLLRRRGPVALIGLSSGIPTAPFIASGAAGNAQLAKLAELLDATQDQFRVVLIHHPPQSEQPKRKRLLDQKALQRVIEHHGAGLVLHGHNHQHEIHWLAGPNGTRVPAVGVPSASAVLRPTKDAAAYNLFRIEGEHGAWRCEMQTRGIVAGGAIATLTQTTLAG
ncbi:MAG: metallophosphoesterase [Pseudolabrys sp.]|nr:metallophosphoesterase [Pseudolabrys sp.]